MPFLPTRVALGAVEGVERLASSSAVSRLDLAIKRSFFLLYPAEYCGQFGAGLAIPCEFGCSESVRESMHMGNPVVQHDGDHLDFVASDGGPSLVHEGALHRGGVKDHRRGGSGGG